MFGIARAAKRVIGIGCGGWCEIGVNAMLIVKSIAGFVMQKFDTKTGKCVGQEFIASDDVAWEKPNGEIIEEPDDELSFPTEMRQP